MSRQKSPGQQRTAQERRFRLAIRSAPNLAIRHGLSSMEQCLHAPKKKLAEEGLELTDAQVQALESKEQDDEAYGEIESYLPGYLGNQDIFYVDTIKGVGRIYQQNFVDTPPKWAAAKLYTTKTHITAADSSVAGFNIGANCGEEAGQTILHAHIHLIPRRKGDCPNPRGGVRGVSGRMGY